MTKPIVFFRNFLSSLKIKILCFGNVVGSLSYSFLSMFCLEFLHDINIKHSVEKAKVK